MAELPNEITTIILSNLPVKSLLRFKCVSKSWFCLIWCPNLKLSNQGRQGAIVMRSTRAAIQRPSFKFVNQQLTLEEVNYPLWDDDEIYEQSCKILGSCRGLILFNVNEHIYLWNPATRLCTKVLELDDLRGDYITHGGLCFDSSKDAYKIVLIMCSYIPGRQLVKIASLVDKQWRKLKFPYDIHSMRCVITLHGRLHYWASDEDDNKDGNNELHESIWGPLCCPRKLTYFDPISEKFHMFPVPEPKSDQEENVIAGLGVLNECLCMTRLQDDKSVEILVMKEYGVKESWASLFFIRNLEIMPSCEDAVPFSVMETGEIVLIIDGHPKRVVVYNPKNDNMRVILVEGEAEYITYEESLISPEECDYDWSELQECFLVF
ncbi:F-box/kelch-repeat protein At3g23880-like [Lycium barbarum]|uniref:F-box/kelch-repeat protein At3g23880-like n=1 Tax=Lycium barbarum TaxID=112863 RepID=UPI00293F4B80|nr:F-box/kelch-repeat protein At3g23880-like [Lycium barbarum]